MKEPLSLKNVFLSSTSEVIVPFQLFSIPNQGSLYGEKASLGAFGSCSIFFVIPT